MNHQNNVEGQITVVKNYEFKELSGFDCNHFLQFESAIYRKHDGQTLAYVIPFHPFQNP